MISLERMRELMAGRDLTDVELQELRTLLWLLAELACDLREQPDLLGEMANLSTHSNNYDQ